VATRKTSKKRPALTALQVGLKHGFRSGLEESLAAQLTAAGVVFEYEETKVNFVEPAKKRTYTPDFRLPNGIIIETKGRFLTEDRQKHLLVKAQHPDLDIRFVFSNSRTKITKRSTTTYADWCVKNGFVYADKTAPDSWLKEPMK
jgi:hypothetical protein